MIYFEDIGGHGTLGAKTMPAARAYRFESCRPHQQKGEAMASLFIWYENKDSNIPKATHRWGVAATSAKTGGSHVQIYFCVNSKQVVFP